MGALTLRSWPYPKGEEWELIWFGSPFMDYKDNWRIRVAFRNRTGEVNVHSYPWGTLPYLRMGQVFKDGAFDEIKPLSGSVYSLSIDSMDQGIVDNGFSLPKRLIDFKKERDLGIQKIVQYKSNGLTFCVPIIELIRSMFVNCRFLAYYLMQPHGLEILVQKSNLHNGSLDFDLSARVPRKLATETNAQHLSWIYEEREIRNMWDSIYQNVFRQALRMSPHNPKVSLRKGIPFEIDLPRVGPIEMYVRGDKFINHVLVKEVIAFNGFIHPARDINFWHPSKKLRVASSADKKVRLTSKPEDQDYILNEHSENARENNNQDVIEAPPTFLRFANSPHVVTRKENVQTSNMGNDVVMATGRGGKNSEDQEVVSTQDSMVGGDTPPIEFQTLETIPVSEAIGLESFFEMIQVMKRAFQVGIRMSVLRVPPGKKFSFCPNGARRTCAVVQVTTIYGTSYIIEVARPDDWSISTLVLRPTKQIDLRAVEKEIKNLIDGLVDKGGHWDQTILDRCRVFGIEKMKHYQSDTPWDWANRLCGKFM